jgi:hypothetical protein
LSFSSSFKKIKNSLPGLQEELQLELPTRDQAKALGLKDVWGGGRIQKATFPQRNISVIYSFKMQKLKKNLKLL